MLAFAGEVTGISAWLLSPALVADYSRLQRLEIKRRTYADLRKVEIALRAVTSDS